jgi:hypothetical protein
VVPFSDGAKVLGTPVGNQTYVDDFLKKKTTLYDNLIESIKKLEDPYLEFYLFQRTAKFCRIGHLYRTLPPEQGAFFREGYLKPNQDFLEYLTRGR